MELHTLGSFGFLLVHRELTVCGEEVCIVVVNVSVVGDGVVFLDKALDGWIGDGIR